ncbi:translation initiation factor IF-2-like [Mustela erminea]|uniref:translation initiation factor IF-2-like n=1 Tax=Mustela erminea TaxID=36723 RepID=UPI0013874D6C|nr:translation initiation factor IF-2-like [Mustela erminea]
MDVSPREELISFSRSGGGGLGGWGEGTERRGALEEVLERLPNPATNPGERRCWKGERVGFCSDSGSGSPEPESGSSGESTFLPLFRDPSKAPRCVSTPKEPSAPRPPTKKRPPGQAASLAALRARPAGPGTACCRHLLATRPSAAGPGHTLIFVPNPSYRVTVRATPPLKTFWSPKHSSFVRSRDTAAASVRIGGHRPGARPAAVWGRGPAPATRPGLARAFADVARSTPSLDGKEDKGK